MSPSEFRSWRRELGLTQLQAATALGISASRLEDYEAGHDRRRVPLPAPIPRSIALACAAIREGIPPLGE